MKRYDLLAPMLSHIPDINEAHITSQIELVVFLCLFTMGLISRKRVSVALGCNPKIRERNRNVPPALEGPDEEEESNATIPCPRHKLILSEMNLKVTHDAAPKSQRFWPRIRKRPGTSGAGVGGVSRGIARGLLSGQFPAK